MSEVTPQPPGSGSRSDPASPSSGTTPPSTSPAAVTAGEPGSAPKSEPKADTKAGSKTEPKAESKTESRGAPKPEPKPGVFVDPKGTSKAQTLPPRPPPAAASKPPASPKPAGRGALWLALLALVFAIAGPLLLWQWSQKNIQELARRVQDSDSRSTNASRQADQAAEQVRELRSRTEVAEAKLDEAAGQQAQLEKLYRSVALDGADALLAELESALSLAAQQLASGGGAEGALLALQSADGRLGRLDDPALVGVRRAIGRDIERLRSATSGDIGVLAARLDNLARSVDDWPLAADALTAAAPAAAPAEAPKPEAAKPEAAKPEAAKPEAAKPEAPAGGEEAAGGLATADGASADGASADGASADGAPADGTPADGTSADAATPVADAATAGSTESTSFVERLRGMIKVDRMVAEITSLFRVRRVDAPDAALIAPDQAYFLRENLRLRLLNARLALLSRNDPLFRGDIEQAVTWIERYFDRRSPAIERALAQLEQLARARTAAEAPSVSDSLGAVRAARAARESRQ